ncbi:four helix bundle protein [Candidatus Dojkabacteria bacterium]|uniref:Four helix bundle protein n=1 Tax=Candidatus Dojkabacteria bacterium TaxID=2099670 RepID=A0A955LB68_9BACT|nr:four helix bundle protein [Candidatus Dojkabacteria bacterium]
MRDFTEILAWEKAHRLTLNIYKITESFPAQDKYNLVQQLRRCSSSIPANIAEGACRHTDKDFAHFLQIAMGSASETKYFILLSRDLGYIQKKNHDALANSADEIMKMLSRFIIKLRANR